MIDTLRNVGRAIKHRMVSIIKRPAIARAVLSGKYIVSVARYNTRNTGDRECVPHRHVKYTDRPIVTIDILEISQYLRFFGAHQRVVLGGSGIFYFKSQVEQLLRQSATNMVVWGVGMNNHAPGKTDEYPSLLESAGLVGVRDYGTRYGWVPCVSCMSPEFDRKRSITQKIIFYKNMDSGTCMDSKNHPIMYNNKGRMKDILDYLGSGEVVVTDSYHALYWAILLGRRVVLLTKYSSKFDHIKWNFAYAEGGDWQSAIKDTHLHPTALTEAREANIAFLENAKRFLGE